MDIPYTVAARPDTGLNNGKIAIWLFLASEVMLFGALFSSYVLLRTGAAPGTWHHGREFLSVPWATLNTMILIGSSVTMVMSWASLKLNDFKKYRLYMGLTLLAGFGFMIVKAIEYGTKFHHGLFPNSNTFLGIYFTLTGLHGLHVLGGMIVNGYFLWPGARLWRTQPERFTNRIEVAGLYWHFVDLVWIFLFPTLYLL